MPSCRIPFCTILSFLRPVCRLKALAHAVMLPFSNRFRPQMTVSKSGTWFPAFRASSFLVWSSVSASAIKMPACGPRPLLFNMRCLRGTWEERNATRGAWVLRPKALSFRLIVWRFGRANRAVSSDDKAWGISFRRRPVNISAKLAI